MKVMKYKMIFPVIWCLLFEMSFAQQHSELLAVTVLYRHGERIPLKFYNNDPYKNHPMWDRELGHMTKRGKVQHYELGKWFRRRYNGFLSPIYNDKEIYIRSSDVDICHISAQTNSAGLYPPMGRDIWNIHLPWQPIPIHTVPFEEDDVLEVTQTCPKYLQLLSNTRSLPYFENINHDANNQNLYAYLSRHTGENIQHFDDVYSIYDTLSIEDTYNYQLPTWTHAVYPQKLKEMGRISSMVYTYQPELIKLATGRLFDHILNQFEAFYHNNAINMPKFKVFSAHGSNVQRMLDALNVPFEDFVPFGATLIFELRKVYDDQFFVEIIYNTREKLDTIQFDGDSSYETFVQLMRYKALNIIDYKNECGV